LNKWRRNSDKGFTMIETLVAVAILATVGVALLSGLMLSTRALLKTDSSETGKDLAVAQMEYIKNLPYSSTYSPDSNLNPTSGGYSVEISTQSLKPDHSLQKVTVKILKSGHLIVQLDDFRTQ
jgi:prepilin-type N-terminal cleavage/methylation domain-containing protein